MGKVIYAKIVYPLLFIGCVLGGAKHCVLFRQ